MPRRSALRLVRAQVGEQVREQVREQVSALGRAYHLAGRLG